MNEIDTLEELSKELSFQEELFCREYIANGGNARQAARAAGYNGNDDTLGQMGSRVSRRPRCVAYIRALKDQVFRERHLTPDAVLAELAALAGFSVGDLLSEDGHLDFTKLDRERRKAIKSVKRKPGKFGTSVELEGHDKLKALELLMQHLGMIKTGPQVAVQVNMDFGERMAARRARALENRDDD